MDSSNNIFEFRTKLIFKMPRFTQSGRHPTSVVRKTVKEYCTQATVHGLKYVSDTNSPPLDRCLWAFVCLISMCLAIALSAKSYIDWQDDPILTTIATTGDNNL